MPDYSSLIGSGMGSNATTTDYAKGAVDTIGKGLGDYAEGQAKEAAANRPLSQWEQIHTALAAGMDPKELATRMKLGLPIPGQQGPEASGLGNTSAAPGGGQFASQPPQPIARPQSSGLPMTQRDLETSVRLSPFTTKRDVAGIGAESRQNVANTQVAGAQALEGSKQGNRVTNQEDAQKNQLDRDAAARTQQDKITRETLDAAAERARMYSERAREEVRSGRGDKKMQALIAIKQRKFDRLSKALDDLVGNYQGRVLGQIEQNQIDQAKNAVDSEGEELDLLLEQEMNAASRAPAESTTRTKSSSTRTKGMKPEAAKVYQNLFEETATQVK